MASKSATITAAITTLDRLLQGERSAVATYEQAQRHLAGQYAPELEANRVCHVGRVDALVHRITALGGKPSTTGGAWVGFTRAIEGTAALLGDGAVIAALEQGEDIGLDSYRAPLLELDPTSRHLVTDDLLPAQERTHQRMSGVKASR